jgi:hypothetical protein
MRSGKSAWLLIALAVPAAGLRGAASTPAGPRSRPAGPATRPRPWQIRDAMMQKWRRYQIAWSGTDIRRQSRADQRLIDAILKDDVRDVTDLRKLMVRAYEHQVALRPRDDFACGRLAARIAVAWTRVPPADTAPAKALRRKEMCERVVHWAARSLEHLAGRIATPEWRRYRAFIPGTAASMLSLVVGRAGLIDEPGAVARRLEKIRSRVMALTDADQTRQKEIEAKFVRYYAAMAPFAQLQRDKEAIGKLLAAFQAAYNGRDDRAFVGLFPPGHPATRPLDRQGLARTVEPSHWKIAHWRPVYVSVRGDQATAYVIARYRAKDGEVHPFVLQPFPARRTAKGWKLN